MSAALPLRYVPPLFNRYEGGEHYGLHIDGAVRGVPGTGLKLRTDLSCTLFLSEPDDYDGGELEVVDTYGTHEVKLPAGDLILYPSSSLHRVLPVTRGARVSSFFWVQSMVRDDAQRALLFELDQRDPAPARAARRQRRRGGADRPVPQPAAHVGRDMKTTMAIDGAARGTQRRGLLAQDAAPVALDQFGPVPAGHAAVRDHRHHAEPRGADRGQAARCTRATAQLPTGAARGSSPATSEGNAPLPASVERLARARAGGSSCRTRRPNGRPTRSTCRCRGRAATPGCASTAPAARSNTSAPTAAGSPTSTTCTRAATPARPGAGSSTSSRWPACVFSVTGLLILKMHAANRPSTWPMVGLGLVLPLLLALLFIH